MPDGLDFVTVAAFVLAYGTCLHALKDRAALAAGETLLVLGASGGTGIAAIEIGKALGARVIAVASSASKLELCARDGADARSEEHTSELQSLMRNWYVVFSLKRKKNE